MRSFADLLETVSAASSSDAARNLVTLADVKAAMRITDSDSDALIDDQIPRVTQLIVDHCRLARDAAGGNPTFAQETLRATWYIDADRACRGRELYLPWRVPVTSIDSVVENGTTLTAGAGEFVRLGERAARLRRLSGDTPTDWSAAKIVVTFKAGFASTLSSTIDKALAAAAIEQLRGWVFGAERDPTVRSEMTANVGSTAYSVPGGDVMGQSVLYPQVRDMLSSWRNSAP